MRDIVQLVRALVPDLLASATPSVACVCTTRPKYLVFGDDDRRPACIVEFGDSTRLMRIDRILRELHSRMGAAVPESLCCTHWQDGVYVHIQTGLAGVPWFRLSDEIDTAARWRSLLVRSADAMRRLHTATRQVDAWSGRVELGAELDRQLALCLSRGTTLGDPLMRCMREWGRGVRSAGAFAACWQHGDFSLNNLLVSSESIAIIDFDEFGGTLAPLHDAFGLALSMTLSQDGRCPLSIRDCLSLCIERERIDEGIDADMLAPLLMHHLLWRINQCDGVERRFRLRDILLGWARELANRPEMFFSQDSASPPR